jgi:hypothetical protein
MDQTTIRQEAIILRTWSQVHNGEDANHNRGDVPEEHVWVRPSVEVASTAYKQDNVNLKLPAIPSEHVVKYWQQRQGSPKKRDRQCVQIRIIVQFTDEKEDS